MNEYISVIIPVYNDKGNLERNLDSLFNTEDRNFEVIVVDDGSDDNPSLIVNKFPCKIIQLPVNKGQAYARNIGVKESNGEIILFTDSDCIVMKDWVRKLRDELIKSHKESENIVAVCGRLTSKKRFLEMCHAYAGYGYVQGGQRR